MRCAASEVRRKQPQDVTDAQCFTCFRLESTVLVRHYCVDESMAAYKQARVAHVMFCGCSRSAPVCSCGLKNNQKVSGVPGVNEIRKVSAALSESAAHWLTLAALLACLSGNGKTSGGPGGNDPSCPACGL